MLALLPLCGSANLVNWNLYWTDPLNFIPLRGLKNPMLTPSGVTDVSVRYVADTFMAHENDTWYMLFDVLNTSSGQGDIGLATSKNEVKWQYEQIVFDEPFHLSYPYVFKWDKTHTT